MAEIPLVSIVVTAYNYFDYLQECLESCWELTYPRKEIVVVDDASTDRTKDMVSCPGCTIIHLSENRGYAAAKNVGVLSAKGSLIRMIDADDMLLPSGLEDQVAVLLENSDVDFVAGRCMRWYGGTDIRGFNAKTKIHAQGWLYRKSLHKRFGLFYEGLRSMADKEFVFRLGIHPESPLPKRIKYRVISTEVALYRKHDRAMHKVRKYQQPELNEKIKAQFNARIKELRRNGITRKNTRFA